MYFHQNYIVVLNIMRDAEMFMTSKSDFHLVRRVRFILEFQQNGKNYSIQFLRLFLKVIKDIESF